jgi:hypothetical protein
MAGLLAACVTRPEDYPRHRSAFGGAAYDSVGARSNDLRDSPGLSSRVTMPRLTVPPDRMDPLAPPSVTLPRAAASAGRVNPLVGIVPGGNAWP